jgi:ribosome-associated protein
MLLSPYYFCLPQGGLCPTERHENREENQMNNELQAVKDLYYALDQKFGTDIVMMDISEISVVADYFVIATGNSALQMQALAAAAEETLSKHGFILNHTEGMRSANWILLDFGSIIVHLFDKENRPFYNLERVWGDARLISVHPCEAGERSEGHPASNM